MSSLTRCLLDKVVARRILEGLLKRSERREINLEELFALDLFYRARYSAIQLFIVPATSSVLDLITGLPRYQPLIDLFYTHVKIAQPTRYFTRWTRRLRGHGFTREDAAVLALGTFGTDENDATLGMHHVTTYDQPMINNWLNQHEVILARLYAMRRQLPPPYNLVTLPKVGPPETVRQLPF